jgi:cysteine desulfurase
MFLQCNAEEIIFTSGATESNNIAIQGVVLQHRTGRVISLSTEHSSVIGPMDFLKSQGYDVVYTKLTSKGQLDLDEFAKTLNDETVLVTISYANSEIGNVAPIAKIAQIIKSYNNSRKTNIILHTDASAAALSLSCDVARLGVDLLSLGGAKIYGPRTGGLLYKKRGVDLRPIVYGGSQESNLRPGTESIDMVAGMAEALSQIKIQRKQDIVNFKELHKLLFEELDNKSMPYIYNGHPKDKIYNVANLSFDGQSGEDLVAKLDAMGFEVATGAACEASNDEPSRALIAIGRTNSEAQGSLRISFGRDTKQEHIKRFVEALSGIIRP